MKLWKILLATMIAMLLVCAVAMAADCDHSAKYVVKTNEVGPIKSENACAYYIEVEYACPNCTWTHTETDTRTENHQFAGEVRHDETCDRGSYYTNKCTACGYVAERDGQTGKLGHDYKWVWTKNPTCFEKGYQKETCSRCGDVKNEAEIDTLNHASGEVVPVTSASCTETYKVVTKCANGDHVIPGTERDHAPDGHAANDKGVITVTAAECAANGHKLVSYKICKNCGETYGEVTKTDYNVSMQGKKNECGVEGYSDHYACGICWATKDKVVYPALTHDYSLQVSYTPADCLNEGKRVMQCKVRNVNGEFCDDTKEIVVPVTGHTKSNDWHVVAAATCTEKGIEQSLCVVCKVVADYREIPALGHDFYTAKEIMTVTGSAYHYQLPDCDDAGWAYARCKNGCAADKYVELPAQDHDWSAWTTDPYDCEDGTVGTRECERCGEDDTKVFVEGTGHKWVVIAGVEPTCEDAGIIDRECSVAGCPVKQYNIYVPATGHQNYEVVAETAPECGKAGSITKKCDDCGKTVTEAIPALQHAYEWVEAVKPSAAGNGKNEYTCELCGDVSKTETVKYTKWYYNNTMTSFGPTTKELVGGSDWYRVTPVDLAVDGVYTYDLIASNKYVVGTVTITVNAGALTVSYSTKSSVEVNDESLLIYASKADLAAGTAVTAPVGAAINATETFGADTKVLVSLVLTGNYDAAGKAYVDADAASAMIANID